MNRHRQISLYYHDGLLYSARGIMEDLEFDSVQEAMRWLVSEFVNIELYWGSLGAGSPYPAALPNAVRSIEQALDTSLEWEIGMAWGNLSSSQRQIADRNFRRIFGLPELAQGANSAYCSHKFERWLVFLEDGLAPLDSSEQDIRTRAKAIRAMQDQIAQQRKLVEHDKFIEHFNAQVVALRGEIGRLTAPALARTLVSIFFEQRQRIRYHLLDTHIDEQGIYYDLVKACPIAAELIHAAMRIANETRYFPLTVSLLLIMWGPRPTWPMLVEAGIAHPNMDRTLEENAPSAARWWRSVVRGHDHEARLERHREYNRRRAQYLDELSQLTPVDRLRRVLVDDKWQVGALPSEYADPTALEALTHAERATLRLRLMRAPTGAWSRLRALA